MIIFGWTTKIKPTAHYGQFYCPVCGVSTTYAECRRKTYFTLYFLPVLRLSDDPGGIQWRQCKRAFDEVPYSYPPEEERNSWKCPECGRDWPETNVRCPICKVRPDGRPR